MRNENEKIAHWGTWCMTLNEDSKSTLDERKIVGRQSPQAIDCWKKILQTHEQEKKKMYIECCEYLVTVLKKSVEKQ